MDGTDWCEVANESVSENSLHMRNRLMNYSSCKCLPRTSITAYYMYSSKCSSFADGNMVSVSEYCAISRINHAGRVSLPSYNKSVVNNRSISV